MNIRQAQEELDEYGEIVVVLESGKEYELHKHDTEFVEEQGIVVTQGIEDDEYVTARFPAKVVEHFYYHNQN